MENGDRTDNVLVGERTQERMYSTFTPSFKLYLLSTGSDISPGLWVAHVKRYDKQSASGCSCSVGVREGDAP
jgi:hypothetical protein